MTVTDLASFRRIARPPLLDSTKILLHREKMKNITVSVDDETYRRPRIKAAEHDNSVSALIRKFLAELAGIESDIERLKRQEREIRERIRGATGCRVMMLTGGESDRTPLR